MKKQKVSSLDFVPQRPDRAQFMARGPSELKERMFTLVRRLSVRDKKRKWTHNSFMIAAIEKFIEDLESEIGI